jgi:predicted DNA-binding transcriptional regulator AlpA
MSGGGDDGTRRRKAAPTRAEVDTLRAKLAGLPDREKFELFDLLRDDLTASLAPESEASRQVDERKAALDAIRQVAGHLDLPPTKAPTAQEFDAAVRGLHIDWTSARVIRVWERWRLAKKAYLGQSTPPGVGRKGRARGATGRCLSEAECLAGVRAWLETEPEAETMPAYEAFVAERRANAKPGELKPALGNTLRRRFALPWPQIVAAARAEITIEDAREVALAEAMPRGTRQAIVGVAAIARLIEMSSGGAEEVVQDDAFPAPVAEIRGHRAWLVRDVKRYRKGLDCSGRREGELQALFVDQPELEKRLALNQRTLWRMIRAKRWDRVPQPEGALATGVYYWRRDKIELWEKATGREAGKEPSVSAPGPKKRKQPDGRPFEWSAERAERYLAGVRLWLESRPAEESYAAYSEFAARNGYELKGTKLPKLTTLENAFPVSWEATLAAARGEASLAELAEVELAKDQPPLIDGALIGFSAIARLLSIGINAATYWTKKDEFPRPVARIRGRRAWLLTDVRAFNRGESFPEHQEFELQESYMDADEILAALALGGRDPMQALRQRIRNERWDQMPQPEGAVARGVYYWKRKKVEAWLGVRDT